MAPKPKYQEVTMTRKRIAKLIYLSGLGLEGYLQGYAVRCNGFDGMIDLAVPSTRVGNAIVRALRATAAERPDLFPVSRWDKTREIG